MSATQRARVLGLAALALCVASCGASDRPESAAGRKPNIVVFVTDTLRADALEAYGNSTVESSALSALAARGVVYERATTSSPWTRPAIASILSGLYPDVHGVQSRYDALPGDIAVLPALLRGAGYATAAITANPNVGSFFGFDRGFDRYIELYRRKRAGYVRARELIATAGDAVDAALEWIEGVDRPFFLFLLTVDPHVPYAPPKGFDRYAAGYDGPALGTDRWLRDEQLGEAGRQRMRSLYWGEVSFNDASLQRLLDRLRSLGLEENTIIVFTADHGEEFWEHGGWGHDKTLYGEILHVPLVVADPRANGDHGSRSSNSVELVDLLPTLLELAGVEAPAAIDGKPLRGESGVARSAYAVSANEGRELFALTRYPWKLIADPRSGKRLLFNLEDDPKEVRDLSAAMPDRTRTLARTLSELQARNRARSAARSSQVPSRRPELLPADERAALQALGYLDAEPPGVGE